MQAAQANAVDRWDDIWAKEGQNNWRASAHALGPVYKRISALLQSKRVVDLGGGCGDLGAVLAAVGCDVTVLDHSPVAIATALSRGLNGETWDARDLAPVLRHAPDVYVSTEFLEHLDAGTRAELLQSICHRPAMLSVPNNRLGPDEEAQHTIKWTAKQFLDYLQQYWESVRVECIGGYLLAVCGAKKNFRLSVCFPARDEAHDIERVLASFRGVADQLIVGIDPRSSDQTEEIARRYADVVFTMEQPQGDLEGEDNVHFGNIRNQCIAHCDGDWIFMTEAHEHLSAGVDDLLALDTLPEHTRVCLVTRRGVGGASVKVVADDASGLSKEVVVQEGGGSVHRWMFPWLWRNGYGYHFERAKHNILVFPENAPVLWVPQVQTFHYRHDDNAVQRGQQRKAYNRKDLFEDWLERGSTSSLYYLASEWRGEDPERTISYFERYLLEPKNHNGPQRYQARLILAKTLIQARRDLKELNGQPYNAARAAKKVLLGCFEDDWSRIDHCCFLGDLAIDRGAWEEATQWYRVAASRWMDMPLSTWWIDEAYYTWLTAERLVQCYASTGDLKNALLWAKRALEAVPVDAPEEEIAEKEHNIRIIEEAINASGNQ